jgi:uncharacterized membrane protein YgdD (TMEM256/DUF423 family)
MRTDKACLSRPLNYTLDIGTPATLGMITGAFGSHGLRKRPGVTPDNISAWQTASQYAASIVLLLNFLFFRKDSTVFNRLFNHHTFLALILTWLYIDL